MTKTKRFLRDFGRKQFKYTDYLALLSIIPILVIMSIFKLNLWPKLVVTIFWCLAVIFICLSKRVAGYSNYVIKKNSLLNIFLSDFVSVTMLLTIVYVVVFSFLQTFWLINTAFCAVIILAGAIISSHFEDKIIK